MKYLTKYKIFETKEKDVVSKFEAKYGTKLDEKITEKDIEILEEAFSYMHVNFIKGKINEIKLKELGGVHGKWMQNKKKGTMYLNPNIFGYKQRFKDKDIDIPYNIFIIIHEIGHCLDHKFGISKGKEWKDISGWEKLERDKKVPDGMKRYIEKRKGREAAGKKKSDWIHKDDADFVRHYASRNPKEDFADSFAFGVFGMWDRFKGGSTKKAKIVKSLLTKI